MATPREFARPEGMHMHVQTFPDCLLCMQKLNAMLLQVMGVPDIQRD